MNMSQIFSIFPLEWFGIGAAIVAGMIIGIERQIHGKPAGIRTSVLICLGTYVFVAVAKKIVDPDTTHLRIVGQVITGIGFLGAGAIIRSGEAVKGLTTAASLWLVAGIGLGVGCGFYLGSLVTAVLTIIVLHFLRYLEGGLIKREGG